MSAFLHPLPAFREGEGGRAGAAARLLPDGRLHLQHGPIDCLCRAWGEVAEIRAAYAQAAHVFGTILPALCAELPLLRTPLTSTDALHQPSPRPPPGRPGGGEAGIPRGPIARAMHAACAPFAPAFITPMAAVAGAVADHVLAAMIAGRALARAFVNNGGDIAFHLAPGETLQAGLVTDLAAPALDGIIALRAEHPSRGLATSGRACKGRGGRSFSFGIADAVTVLAATAAEADAAATIVANAVDLPGHPAITRRPASDIDPDSDLGERLITWDLGPLTRDETQAALDAGRRVADALLAAGLIDGAVLALGGRFATSGTTLPRLERP